MNQPTDKQKRLASELYDEFFDADTVQPDYLEETRALVTPLFVDTCQLDLQRKHEENLVLYTIQKLDNCEKFKWADFVDEFKKGSREMQRFQIEYLKQFQKKRPT